MILQSKNVLIQMNKRMKKIIKSVVGVIIEKVMMNFLIIMHLVKVAYYKKEKRENRIK